MTDTGTLREPLPKQFATLEDAAAFWETHDTMDYPEAFRRVEVDAEFRGRCYEVALPGDVGGALRLRAKELGVSMGELAAQLLREHLPVPA